MADFDDICDAYCFQRSLMPSYIDRIYTQVARTYARLYTRWDIPEDALALISIDLWKHGHHDITTIRGQVTRIFGEAAMRRNRRQE